MYICLGRWNTSLRLCHLLSIYLLVTNFQITSKNICLMLFFIRKMYKVNVFSSFSVCESSVIFIPVADRNVSIYLIGTALTDIIIRCPWRRGDGVYNVMSAKSSLHVEWEWPWLVFFFTGYKRPINHHTIRYTTYLNLYAFLM